MANQASDYHRGEMDISEQAKTYDFVMSLTKWGSLGTAALVLFLTLWFCTEAGFLGAFVATVVLVAAGIVFLRGGADKH